MRFKRINMDTVRCIVSETELIENGLQMDDFLQNDGKTEDFLRKIVSMAEEEVGFKVQGGPLSVQVAVLPEHLLALTFSERPDSNILNILQNYIGYMVICGQSLKTADFAMSFRHREPTGGKCTGTERAG